MTNATQKTVFGHITTTQAPDICSKDTVHYLFKFENGFGASVVRWRGTYGAGQGLWELAVVGQDGELTYSTPITPLRDVLSWLTETQVRRALNRIQALEA